MADAGGGGQFSNVWTLAEAASRDPFHPGQFLALLWENTSGYLLVACLVSVAAVLLTWVYMVRAGPLEGPDHRTGTRPTADRAEKVSEATASSTPPAAAAAASDAATTGPTASPADDGPDDGPDDGTSPLAGPPPPPPVIEEEEGAAGGEVPDLVEMAHHLPARVKQAELRHIRQTLQGDMTEEQRRRERQVESEQMAAILQLMQQNSDKFGKPSLDDMQAQLKLYM